MHSHQNNSPINSLPTEVMLNIASYFHHTNALTASPVSSLWNALEKDDQVWEARFKRFFPDIHPAIRDESEQDEFGKINYQASFKHACQMLKKHFNNQEAFDDCLAFRGGDLDRLTIILSADNREERIHRIDCFGKNLLYFLRVQTPGHYRQTALNLIYTKYQSQQTLSDDEISTAAQYGQINLLQPLFGLTYDSNMPPLPEVNQRYDMNYWRWHAEVQHDVSSPNMMTVRRVSTSDLSRMASKAIEFNQEDLYKLIENDGDYALDKIAYNGQRNIFNILHGVIRNQRHIVVTKYIADKIFNLMKTFPEMQMMPNLAMLTPIMQTFAAYDVDTLAHMGLFFWAVVLKQDNYIADCQFSEADKRLLANAERARYFYHRAFEHAPDYLIALIKKGCVFFDAFTAIIRSGTWHPVRASEWRCNAVFDEHPLHSILKTKNYALLKKIFLQAETTPEVKKYLLEHAAKENDYFAFKFMMNNGGLIDGCIVDAAVGFNSANVVKLIASKPDNELLLHSALIKKPSADIFSILPESFNFDRKSPSGPTLLTAVVFNMYLFGGTVRDLTTLIERGADPFFESDSGPGRTARERLETYAGYELKRFIKENRFLGCFFEQSNIKEVLKRFLNNPAFYLSQLAPEKRELTKMLVEAWDYVSRVEYERLQPEYYAGLSSI